MLDDASRELAQHGGAREQVAVHFLVADAAVLVGQDVPEPDELLDATRKLRADHAVLGQDIEDLVVVARATPAAQRLRNSG